MDTNWKTVSKSMYIEVYILKLEFNTLNILDKFREHNNYYIVHAYLFI